MRKKACIWITLIFLGLSSVGCIVLRDGGRGRGPGHGRGHGHSGKH